MASRFQVSARGSPKKLSDFVTKDLKATAIGDGNRSDLRNKLLALFAIKSLIPEDFTGVEVRVVLAITFPIGNRSRGCYG